MVGVGDLAFENELKPLRVLLELLPLLMLVVSEVFGRASMVRFGGSTF